MNQRTRLRHGCAAVIAALGVLQPIAAPEPVAAAPVTTPLALHWNAWGNKGGGGTGSYNVAVEPVVEFVVASNPTIFTISLVEVCQQQVENIVDYLAANNIKVFTAKRQPETTDSLGCKQGFPPEPGTQWWGNAVLVGGTVTGWHAREYTNQNAAHPHRGFVCAKANALYFTYTTCSTHLENVHGSPYPTGEETARTQLDEFMDWYAPSTFQPGSLPIIMGDFNFHHAAPNPGPDRFPALYNGTHNGYTFSTQRESADQASTCDGWHYTCPDPETTPGKKIDYLWMSSAFSPDTGYIYNPGPDVSDHYLLFAGT